MTASDIESIAVDTVKKELRKYLDMFTPHLQENDKTPFWDGEIFVYKDANKTKKDYADRIFVQVKGIKVEKIKKGNSKFKIEVETLRGFQKDKKGTLLFVTEIEDIENTQLYYANLLPVDLKEILDRVKPTQQSVTIDIKPVIDKTSSSIKFICLNFLKNSEEQLNIAIKRIEDLKDIKEIKIPIQCEQPLLDQYLINNDIYSYAITNENEKVALPKLKDIHTFSEKNNEIKIRDRVFYTKTKNVISKEENYLLFGNSMKVHLNKNKVDIKILGNVYERIRDIEFLLALIKEKAFYANGQKIDMPLEFPDEKARQFIETIKENLIYYKKVEKAFDKFGIRFNLNLDKLEEKEQKNLNMLLNILAGIYPKDLEETKIYNIKIASYKIAFLMLKSASGQKYIYNYFENLDNKLKVYYLNEFGEETRLSVYINMKKDNFLEYSNINYDIIKESFTNTDFSSASLAKINELLLEILSAYDCKKDDNLLDLANFIIDKVLQHSKEDVYLINQMQIIKRQRELTKEEKMILYKIKKENNDKQIQLGLAILLDNKSDYEIYSEELTQEEKESFSKFPISNLINFG